MTKVCFVRRIGRVAHIEHLMAVDGQLESDMALWARASLRRERQIMLYGQPRRIVNINADAREGTILIQVVAA